MKDIVVSWNKCCVYRMYDCVFRVINALCMDILVKLEVLVIRNLGVNDLSKVWMTITLFFSVSYSLVLRMKLLYIFIAHLFYLTGEYDVNTKHILSWTVTILTIPNRMWRLCHDVMFLVVWCRFYFYLELRYEVYEWWCYIYNIIYSYISRLDYQMWILRVPVGG